MKLISVVLVIIGLLSLVQSKGPYKVVGNKIYDSDGNPHLFVGVDRPSLEWSASGDHLSQADFHLMASWKSNVVRIPLDQDFWLVGSRNYSANYNNTVYTTVQWAQQAGLDVILDLHWSDKGDLATSMPGQQRIAYVNSITFWKEVANIYKNNPSILFELYNEPHDVSWEVWLNGGDSGDGFNSVGMQQLYDAVRSTGATNLVVIGGLNWAYDLSGVPQNRVKGDNIIYNTHPYNYGGKQPADWPASFGFLAATDPVIATEFGDSDCSPGYYSSFLAYAKQNGISWTSWAWYVNGCEFPSIINDWQGTPSVSGALVKAALAEY